MALLECPDCGREVSDQAPACPHCGRPLNGAGIAPAPARDWLVHQGLNAANTFGGILVLILAVVLIFSC